MQTIQNYRSQINHKPAQRGGQATIPAFFGLRLTGDTGSAPEAKAVRAVQQLSQARLVVDDRPRRIGGLIFGQRRAMVGRPSPEEIERRNAAMRAAAHAADLRDERDWNRLADLAACPEWDRALPYGGVETALALDDHDAKEAA